MVGGFNDDSIFSLISQSERSDQFLKKKKIRITHVNWNLKARHSESTFKINGETKSVI